MPDNLDFAAKCMQGFAVLARVPAMTYRYNKRVMVYQYGKVKLYHYEPKTKKPTKRPLLVVFATVNRPEILDLFPEHSFIGGLLNEGRDVYLLDWGYPDARDHNLTLSDYITDLLPHSVDYLIRETHQSTIDLLGICQGGLICLCYAALFKKVKNLVLISTPIDFGTKDNVIAKFFKKINVDDLIALMQNVPGSFLSQFFISLRPFKLVGEKYLHFIDHLNDEEKTAKFLQVEKWLNDAPDQTGASFAELVKELYQGNKLIKGEFDIQGKKIDLAQLTMPILNVMASFDEIVPVSASRILKKYVGSKDYSQCIFPSGHIGIYISDKVGQRMTQAIADWLRQHD